MPKYLDINGLRTLWAQITNKISHESNATAEALAGKADLVEGKIPASQLPSYVDDVLEYTNKASFPATGESGKIYLDLATNLAYRWGGTAYTEISPSLALGTTSSTAYRGDYGAAAYTHAVTNKGIAKSSGLYKITTNAEGHVTAATAVVKADITGLGIPAQDTTYENATTTTNGLMSSTDKTKLNSIDLSALVKSVNGITPDSNGNVAIEVGGGTVSGDYLPLTGGTLTGTLYSRKTSPALAVGTASTPTLTAISMATADIGTRMYFTHYDQNSSYYENFALPATKDLTTTGNYWILTTKSPVTVAQGGTGATTAADARTALGITDNKVAQTLTDNTTSKTFYLLSGESTTSTTTGSIFNKDLKANIKNGTADTEGFVELYLGNATAKGSAGNKTGKVALYSNGTRYHLIIPSNNAITTNITHTLPTVSGTFLNTGNYSSYALPLTGGTLTGNLTISNSNNYSYLYLANQNGENIGGLYASDSENRLYLINHVPNSTAGKYEGYGLPPVTTDNLTEHKWYKILTSKETVTVAQGGTGATTPETARTALGITPANIGAAPSSHTHTISQISDLKVSATAPSSPTTGTIWIDIS